jgi:UDP-GlcNAc:undecaprenyl-phosphate GlcNAc-1-phosphate transferase
MTIAIILTLGDTGRTNLVLAGLVIYAVPIIDTALAIIRRRLAGKKLSEGDSDHLHHMLKRMTGVKGAAFILYAIGLVFAILGVVMTLERARMTYALVLVAGCFIAVTAIKSARRKHFEDEAKRLAQNKAAGKGAGPALPPGPPATPSAAPASTPADQGIPA